MLLSCYYTYDKRQKYNFLKVVGPGKIRCSVLGGIDQSCISYSVCNPKCKILHANSVIHRYYLAIESYACVALYILKVLDNRDRLELLTIY
jgi:hypothetical protein